MQQSHFGRYQLLSSLGQGASAEVFRALLHQANGTKKEVALKIFSKLSEKSDVIREAQFGRKVSHPNIVKTYCFSQHKGLFFIEMEYVDGGSVADLLKNRTSLDEETIAELIRQSAQGLNYLHRYAGNEGGMVHADLKPSNILLTRNGLVKITDLGIAHHPSIENSNMTGTLSYMSPEQVIGHPLDARSDLFSLGVIIYELSTGSRLFRGRQPFAIMGQIRDVDAWLKDEERKKCLEGQAEWLRTLIADLLRFNPAERPQSAEDILNRLPKTTGALASLFEDDCDSVISSNVIEHKELEKPFVGRQKELGILSAMLQHRSTVFLHGPVGVGKSRLVRQAVQGERKLFVNLEPSRGNLVEQTCSVLKIPVDPILLQAELKHYEMVVFDNFEPFISMLSDLLCWDIEPCKIIFVSSVETAVQMPSLHLNPLPFEQSLELFNMLVGTENQSNQSRIQQILKQLDGLPLAIELAAAHFSSGAEQYSFEVEGFDSALEYAWSLLSKEAKEALMLIQVIESDLSEDELVAFLKGSDVLKKRDLVGYLKSRAWLHLELNDDEVVLGMYKPLKQFLRKKSGRENSHKATLDLARFCAEVYFSFSPPEPFILFQRRRERALSCLRISIRAALRDGLDSLALRCSLAAAESMLVNGKNPQGRTILKRVAHLNNISNLERGALYLIQARYAQAQGDSNRALELLNSAKGIVIKDHPLHLELSIFSIYALTDAGRWEELDLLIAQIKMITGFTPRQSGSLHRAIGYALLQRGDMQRSYDHLQASQQALLAEGDIGQAISAFTSLGVLKFREQSLEEAEYFYRNALDLAQRHHLVNDVEHAWMNLGLIMILMNRLEEAGPLLEKAEQRYRRTGAHGAQALLLANRSFLSLIQEDFSSAYHFLEKGKGRSGYHSHPIAKHTLLMVEALLLLIDGALEEAWDCTDLSLDVIRHHMLKFKVLETYLIRAEIALVLDDLHRTQELLGQLHHIVDNKDQLARLQLLSLSICYGIRLGEDTQEKEKQLQYELKHLRYPRPDLLFHIKRHKALFWER
ncbi:MAG: hypothetical protein CMK59_10380 [Proteobacteria bacterium]|nr:hypothetical protein [Pseudomonadota bacterium]